MRSEREWTEAGALEWVRCYAAVARGAADGWVRVEFWVREGSRCGEVDWLGFLLMGDCRRFDVPTFFGRDLLKCRGFAEAWYGDALPKSRAEVRWRFLRPSGRDSRLLIYCVI